MKMYRRCFDNIKELEVIKTTDKMVTFINSVGREMKELKESNFVTWHETKEEAHDKIISDIKYKIEHLSKQIEYNKKMLEKAIANKNTQ